MESELFVGTRELNQALSALVNEKAYIHITVTIRPYNLRVALIPNLNLTHVGRSEHYMNNIY